MVIRGFTTVSVPTKCYDNGSPECSTTTEGGQNLCCDSYDPTCFTAFYSTTTSETFTYFTCSDNIAFSNPATMSTTKLDTTTITGSAGTSSAVSSTSVGVAASNEPSSPDTAKGLTSPTAKATTAQPPSSVPVGAIVGGSLGGLAITAAVAVALVWILCVTREGGRFHKSRPVEANVDDTNAGGGAAQPGEIGCKPELSATSPATVPRLMSLPSFQQGPHLGRGNDSALRPELPTG
ncbi:hypothetical protein J7T55_011057 [Diaporthe amygdali]|uniref:uncharacterized protein n=1 Tax=Phomopsis amygdali TaxID=1214568 RepID=UPI0022FDB5AC|nr:uncharacterized protein J7T55_011057 [Diaporthe amygdali]KAJ0106962.1 hypothetical protein J7T55_011057 [Diaporthe amygdali]